MYKRKSQIINRLLILTGAIATLSCRNSFADEEFVDPPEDQGVTLGETATFSVEPRHAGLAYQWLRQWPDRTEVLSGETGNQLTFTNTAISDVGHYLCAVAFGNQVQLTRAASLTLWMPRPSSPAASLRSIASSAVRTLNVDPVTAFAAPTTSSGSSGTCPGSYAGYVTYRKTTALGWGWSPSTNTTVHTAADNARNDTKLVYGGYSGDSGCQQTVVTVATPPTSSKYRFTIYFPTNVPSTNAYPITLSGFDP